MFFQHFPDLEKYLEYMLCVWEPSYLSNYVKQIG